MSELVPHQNTMPDVQGKDLDQLSEALVTELQEQLFDKVYRAVRLGRILSAARERHKLPNGNYDNNAYGEWIANSLSTPKIGAPPSQTAITNYRKLFELVQNEPDPFATVAAIGISRCYEIAELDDPAPSLIAAYQQATQQLEKHEEYKQLPKEEQESTPRYPKRCQRKNSNKS